MSFKTLGEALESALASALNGEGSVAADPVSPKEAGTAKAPASREEVVNTTRRRHASGDATLPAEAASPTNGRGRRAHPKASKPLLGARRPILSVIEGGGRRQEGGASAAYRYEPPRVKGERMGWGVVEGGRHSALW